MSVEELYRDYDFSHWHDLFPQEQQYVNFEPYIIYAANKIDDVYYAFANARSYLSDYDCEQFGQLISRHDETHLRFIRSKFLQSSLAFYNYAIDLSWQVAWFYVGDNSYLFMEDPQYYEFYSKLCTRERLINKLSMYYNGPINLDTK